MVNPFSNPLSYDSLGDFIRKNPSRIYRYWIYRHGYTPYEQKQCYSDESLYEETCARLGVLREVITLADGNALLGFTEFIEDTSEIVSDVRAITYYRLCDIRMTYMPMDTERFDSEGILKNGNSAMNNMHQEDEVTI